MEIHQELIYNKIEESQEEIMKKYILKTRKAIYTVRRIGEENRYLVFDRHVKGAEPVTLYQEETIALINGFGGVDAILEQLVEVSDAQELEEVQAYFNRESSIQNQRKAEAQARFDECEKVLNDVENQDAEKIMSAAIYMAKNSTLQADKAFDDKSNLHKHLIKNGSYTFTYYEDCLKIAYKNGPLKGQKFVSNRRYIKNHTHQIGDLFRKRAKDLIEVKKDGFLFVELTKDGKLHKSTMFDSLKDASDYLEEDKAEDSFSFKLFELHANTWYKFDQYFEVEIYDENGNFKDNAEDVGSRIL